MVFKLQHNAIAGVAFHVDVHVLLLWFAILFFRGFLSGFLAAGSALPALLDKSCGLAVQVLQVSEVLLVVVSKHHLNVLDFELVPVDCALHVLLLLGPPYDLLFHGAPSHESVDSYRLGLTDTVSTVSSLFVHRGVPIIIVENYSVSSNQIDAQATSSGRQKEGKDVWVLLVLVNHESAVLELGRPIHPEVAQVLCQQVILK